MHSTLKAHLINAFASPFTHRFSFQKLSQLIHISDKSIYDCYEHQICLDISTKTTAKTLIKFSYNLPKTNLLVPSRVLEENNLSLLLYIKLSAHSIITLLSSV